MELRGTVRFRFRSPEHDIDVLLEGEAKWVESVSYTHLTLPPSDLV